MGKTTTVDCEPSDTVREFKAKLSLQVNLAIGGLRLVYSGQMLENDKTLSDYHVQKECTLLLAGRLLGGMVAKIKMISGRILEIECEPSDTFLDLKLRIAELEGHDIQIQRLLYKGQKGLQDHALLADLQGKQTLTVHLVVQLRGGMQIKIQALTKGTFEVDCEPSDTFEDLKKKIEEQAGIPVGFQRLIFKGKCCMDEATLHQFGVVKGDTVYLVLRMRAG